MKVRFNWLSVVAIVSISLLTSCLDNDDSGNAQLTADINTIDQYLQTNPPTDYLLRDDYSGMRFVIHTFGVGLFPSSTRNVKVTYEGRLLSNGTLVDAGTYNGALSGISPPGLGYAVGSLLEGTEATIYVPSTHAYGPTGTTNIPANSILVYTFSIDEVVRTTTEVNQWKADTATIHDHLEDELLDVVELASGVSYVIEEQGTGEYPVLFDLVSFDYEMMLLNGTSVDDGNLSQWPLYNLIDALKGGIPQVNEGTKVTFYIPSLYGYGATTHGTIPANSILKFEMTLTSVDSN